MTRFALDARRRPMHLLALHQEYHARYVVYRIPMSDDRGE